MSHEVVCFSTPTNLRKKVDKARGDASRSKYITRAIEAYINRDPPVYQVTKER
jgi:metal-responsive CopG/Arc/MetJ family transcriptional regulator